jgi:predicted RNA-binding protein
MCLAKAYLEGDGGSELLLEDIALLEVGENVLRISTLFGDRQEIPGVIREVDFQTSSITIQPPPGPRNAAG